MLQSIFVVLGLLIFIKLLFDKWNVWGVISEVGSKSDFEWVYKLTNCQFCLLFHFSWMITIVYWIANGFSWSLLIVPFIVSGLIHLIYQK